jgi:glycosyltransferase involved in cell wall biosynthesis
MRAESTNTLGVDADRIAEGLNVKRVYVPGGIDVISFQRPSSPSSFHVIEWLRRNRPQLGIVVELDAEMTMPYTDIWLRRAMDLAHVVTLSTPAQSGLYPHDNKRVIRDSVPSTYLTYPARTLSRKKSSADIDADRIIGGASLDSRDIGVMGGVLSEVVGADRTGGRRVTFRYIGEDWPDVYHPLGVARGDFEASGALPPNLYHVALGEIDIAVVPQETPRSGIRALEFAAAGVPVIGSITPEHEWLRDAGMPLWLVKPRGRDWLKALRSVLSLDDAELKDLARQHRENVRMNHTTEQRAIEWADAWRSAAKLAKKGI